MISKSSALFSNISHSLCGNILKKNNCLASISSKRSFSHSKGTCSCSLCAKFAPNFQNKLVSSTAQFHVLSQGKSPLLCKQSAIIPERIPELSERLIQKRAFAFSKTDSEDAKHIDVLLKNNAAWVEDIKKNQPAEYLKLSLEQRPKYLYFGCSDSRVPANEIFGLGPGDLFVHRSVGNLVPGDNLNVLAVLEFAVTHLGVTDIIVTGHYNCGAVRAAAVRQDLGTLENWLRAIRDVYRLHRKYLDAITDPEEKHRKLVELNVVEQCINIYKTGIVQRKRLENKKKSYSLLDQDYKNAPRIHGLVFDMPTGTLERLTVDYSSVGDLDKIYGLY